MSRFRRFRFLAGFGLALLAEDSAGGGATGATPPTTTQTPPANGGAFAQADLDTAVANALQARDAATAKRLKELTGADSLDALAEAEAKRKGEEGKLLEQRNAENAQLRSEIAASRIESALTLAATAGGAIDPADVHALLAGKAKFENGAVTVDGKPAADAVAALLKAKPHLAKAGPAGGGAPQQGANTSKQKTRAEFEALSAKDRMDFMTSGGVLV